MSAATDRKKNSYGLFASAAAIYMAGVVAFSVWSYFEQRNNILAQVDQSLINTTYATELILGNIFIECAVETETSWELGYTDTQKNLDRLADSCHFDILGAMGYKNGKLWELIGGSMSNGSLPPDHSNFHRVLHSRLSPIVRTLSQSSSGSIRMETIASEEYGQLRMAIRYRPISDDAGYAILAARNTDLMKHSINALAMRAVGVGIFLYAMAFPLIVLYHFARTRSSRETAELSTRLQQDYVKLKDRESDLEDAVRDLERFNAVALGRESRIIELKAEVNALLEQMQQNKRYNVDHTE